MEGRGQEVLDGGGRISDFNALMMSSHIYRKNGEKLHGNVQHFEKNFLKPTRSTNVRTVNKVKYRKFGAEFVENDGRGRWKAG